MSMHRPDTDALRREIIDNTAEHQFLAAGAGAGKTRTLVDHYFHLLDQGLRPAQLVAVTFTEKAAAEMKQRLREQCSAQARQHRRAGETDRARVWEERLHELELAPISTIHGFCARILRENSLAADLDPDFAVLDEPRSRLLLDEAVRRSLLERLGDESSDTAATLVVSLGYDQAVEQLRVTVSRRTLLREVLMRPDYASPAKLLASWQDRLLALQASLLKEIINHPEFRSSARQVCACAGPPDDKLEAIRLEVATICEEAGVADWDCSGLGTPTQTGMVETLLKLKDLRSPGNVGRGGDWQKLGYDIAEVRGWVAFFCGTKSPILELLEKLADLNSDPVQDERCARLTCALVAETNAAIAAYEGAKQQQAALDFEDLLEKTQNLWGNNGAALERARQGLRHLMIDEFQDTNTLQKQVLWPLVTGVAYRDGDPGLGGHGARLFIVGDAKQSIYRFRNADVAVFNRTGHEMVEAGCRHDELTRNFRSTQPLIEVYNRLFGDPAVMGPDASEVYQASYSDMQARREGPGGGQPPALLHLIKSRKTSDDTEEEAEDTRSAREQEAKWIAGHVRQMLEGNSVRVARRVGKTEVWEAPRPGDIALLFRSMTDIRLYERALREAGLPYYLVVGRGFFTAQEVQDVVNVLRALENRLADVAVVGALRSPLFGLSDATLYWLARGRAASWRERVQRAASGAEALSEEQVPFEQSERLRFAEELLSDLEARKDRLTLASLVQELLDRTGLTAVLAAQFGGLQGVSNLRKLVEVAGEFQIGRQLQGQSGLRDFIEYLKQMQAEEIREGQAPIEEEAGNSIKLMTVHGAKGLQWPIVILPDLARQAPGDSGAYRWHPELGLVVRETKLLAGAGSNSYWPPVGREMKDQREAEEEAEKRRLFYVAATRAQDLLIMSGSVQIKRDGGVGETGKKSVLGWLNAANPQSLWAEDENTAEEVLFTWDGETWVRAADLQVTDEMWEIAEAPADAAPVPPLADIISHLSPLAPVAEAQRRFTATELALYAHCPHLYQAQFRFGLPGHDPRFSSGGNTGELSAAQFGTMVHEVLQLVGSEGVARLPEALARLPEEIAPRVRSYVQPFIEAALYRETVADARRLRSEMQVAAPLEVGGQAVLIEGVVDALAEGSDGGRHLLDYKTGREDETKAAQYRLQLGLYCYAVKAATGNLPAGAHVVYLSAGGLKTESLPVAEITQEAVTAAIEAIAGIWAGDFAPRPESCGRCVVPWCSSTAREVSP